MRRTIYRGLGLAGLLAGALLARADIPLENPNAGKPTEGGIAVPTPKATSGPTAAPKTPAKRSPLGDVLSFKDGDLLRGNMVSADAKDGLQWKRPDVADTIHFKEFSNVQGIKLQKLDAGQQVAGATRVRLTNDDLMYGKITEMTADKLTLETWYAGRVTLERPMVKSLQPGAKAVTELYSGPNNLNEWQQVQGQNNWKFQKGKLVGSGGLGREMKFPDLCSFQFELQSQGRFLNFVVSLHTNDLRNFYGDCYLLQVNNNAIYLNRNVRNQGQVNLGQINNVPELTTNQRLRFEVLMNRKEKTFAVLLNDKLLKEFVDPQEWAGKGTGVVFMFHDRNSTMSLSNVRVLPWDGKLRQAGEKGGTTDQDLVQFVNEDKVAGKLLGIKDGRIAFQTPFATLDIPLDRVAVVLFSEKAAERARRNKDDVQAYYPDGNHVTLRLTRIGDNRLSGNSENCGDLALSLDALVGIRFNVYDQTAKEGDDDGGGSFERLLFDNE